MARNISVVQEPAYFEALGRLVNEFAAVESALLFALKTYAKVSWPVARAIFSGARVETAMDFVKRICDACDPGEERRKELDDVFKQLRAINEMRNSLLHYDRRSVLRPTGARSDGLYRTRRLRGGRRV
jgi:hypothetical protein